MPNIIGLNSPDNNTFLAFSNFDLTIEDISIFDRWGNLVHNKENFSYDNNYEGWDGTMNGEKVEQGVYVYTITYRDSTGQLRNEKGSITVIY